MLTRHEVKLSTAGISSSTWHGHCCPSKSIFGTHRLSGMPSLHLSAVQANVMMRKATLGCSPWLGGPSSPDSACCQKQGSSQKSWAGRAFITRRSARQFCTGSMLGSVRLCAEHVEVGYMSHPAVTDSSMHLSIFLGGSDGRTRVPGKSHWNAPLFQFLGSSFEHSCRVSCIAHLVDLS